MLGENIIYEKDEQDKYTTTQKNSKKGKAQTALDDEAAEKFSKEYLKMGGI
jgi:hypothetical protein